MTPEVRLQWGHEVRTPDGKTIQLPLTAIIKLRRLGVIEKVKGYSQLSPFIYELMDPEYDALLDGLRSLLGQDFSGPDWLVCRCKGCKRQRELVSREVEQLQMFQLDMAVQRSADSRRRARS
jgi:hypothetical protein